jgi:hypothetical protein
MLIGRYAAGDFPESEKAAQETIALPVYPELTQKQQDEVIETIRTFYQLIFEVELFQEYMYKIPETTGQRIFQALCNGSHFWEFF